LVAGAAGASGVAPAGGGAGIEPPGVVLSGVARGIGALEAPLSQPLKAAAPRTRAAAGSQYSAGRGELGVVVDFMDIS